MRHWNAKKKNLKIDTKCDLCRCVFTYTEKCETGLLYAATQIARRFAGQLPEQTRKVILIRKSDRFRDLPHRKIGGKQQFPRPINAHGLREREDGFSGDFPE